MEIPRNEYPRPDMVRGEWLNLNGEWEFGLCAGNAPDDPYARLDRKITVPFCPESELSGVHYTGFMKSVLYRRTFTLPQSFSGKRALLHFGAVDYAAYVYVNGAFVGSHRGGYTPFCFDITGHLNYDGETELFVRADDDVLSPLQPSGKQSARQESYGCFYTRTTGIWQTVWLEPVGEKYVKSYRAYPDISKPGVKLVFALEGAENGDAVKINVTYEGVPVGSAEAKAENGYAEAEITLAQKHLWEPGAGRLYDFTAAFAGDGIRGYFGLREIGLDENGMTVNGKPFFGRFVLDQGYYPQGIYTAPDDEALKADIEKSLALGFNGARLHQKVFEPRFLYHADLLGYPVWGEYPSWGFDITEDSAADIFIPEWLESVERDFSHPCVIGWCPFNETWDRADGKRRSGNVLKAVYYATKAADGTRPVIDTSGNYHEITDIFDVHDYEQDPAKFRSYYARADEGVVLDQIGRESPGRQKYPGGPLFVSEYGGIKWSVSEEGWGYGESVKSKEEFLARYKGLTDVLLENKKVCAFCYTQLYDIEQEQNGLLTYGREFKFAPQDVYGITARKNS